MTLSKGEFILNLPEFGTGANVAYVLANNILYVSKRHREVDGPGDGLSRGAVTQ